MTALKNKNKDKIGELGNHNIKSTKKEQKIHNKSINPAIFHKKQNKIHNRSTRYKKSTKSKYQAIIQNY